MSKKNWTGKFPKKLTPTSLCLWSIVEFRKFVSHPSYAKTTVSENFRTDSLLKLPKPNHCSKDFSSGNFLVPIITYQVCSIDCVIFAGEISSCETWPKCGQNRYKNGKPIKVFKYLPLAQRIARMYQNENLVRLLQAHSTRNKNGIMNDILDTDRWKKSWFGPNREFNDKTGCVLNFCTDGVNP